MIITNHWHAPGAECNTECTREEIEGDNQVNPGHEFVDNYEWAE